MMNNQLSVSEMNTAFNPDLNPFNAISGHPSVTEKYQFIDTNQVMQQFESLGFTESARRSSNSVKYKGYQKHIAIMHANTEIHGDSMPSIFIKNSHKAGSLVISLGYFRICCENQLPFAIEGFTFNVRHMGNVKEKLEKVMQDIVAKVAELKTLKLKLEGIQCTHDMKQALVSTLNSQRPTTVKSTDEQVFAVNRSEDIDTNLWTMLNRVQEFAVRGGGPRSGVRALRSSVSIHDVSAALIETAVQLAA